MKRTKANNIERRYMILSADWHLREDQPTCRTDDHWETQWKKVSFISQLSKQYNAPVIIAGDLFDHWKPSPRLLSYCIRYLPEKTWVVYGNHDMPQHNIDLLEKSGINVLKEAGRIQVLEDTHFNQALKGPSWKGFVANEVERAIGVWHTYVWKDEKPFPGITSPKARDIIKKAQSRFNIDIILTGDNHQKFVETYKGTKLVNPGSILRQTAAMIDHQPAVFLWDYIDNALEEIPLPIEENVISREHIDLQKKKDNRMSAFINTLKGDWKDFVSFEKNVDELVKKSKVSEPVESIVNKALDREI